MTKLFDELKRRNVIRVAIAYAVASWLLLQVADLVLDNISAPGWVMQVFMLALALGFPFVLLFSWVFELTPEGLRRENEVDRERSVAHYTARKLDRVTIVLLVLVLLSFGAARMLPATAPPGEAAGADIEDKSIAVRAFDDLSPNGDQEYFAEGISEELLNVLAQIPDLKVAGRTSSFAFKGQKRDLREIGDILKVAHILEGSVRKSGDKIRVTAQLVKADDGFHLFSKNYDRKLDDIFEVQDDIAHEIGMALRSAILGADSIEPVKPAVAEAYDSYLRARQWIHTRDETLMTQAADLLDRAIAIDPDYAPAYAYKAQVLLLLSDSSYGDIPAAEARSMSRPLIDKALQLDPDLAEAHAILGLWYRQSDSTRDEAIAALRKSLALNPSQSDARNWLSILLAGTEWESESRSLLEAVVERDPMYWPAFNNLIFSYVQTRDLDRASTLVSRVERIVGNSPGVRIARGAVAYTDGQLAKAVDELRGAYELNPSSNIARSLYAGALASVGDYDTAAELAYVTDRLSILELADRHDEAVALFESLKGREYDVGELRTIGDWLLMQDRPADLVQLVQDNAVNSDDWIAEQVIESQLYGAMHFTNLAFALRQLGRDEEADRFMAKAAETLAIHERQGADNEVFWLNSAEYAALTGDPDGMVSFLQKAVDGGYAAVYGFLTPTLDRYRGDPRFIELENEVIRRANEERRKLGLVASTDFAP